MTAAPTSPRSTVDERPITEVAVSVFRMLFRMRPMPSAKTDASRASA
jgi:hypothetical protein